MNERMRWFIYGWAGCQVASGASIMATGLGWLPERYTIAPVLATFIVSISVLGFLTARRPSGGGA